MTTIIYRYEVDGVPKYVGSSFDYRYTGRQTAHLKALKTNMGINSDRVKFYVLEECEDAVRFDREWHYINSYKSNGYEIWNVADPRKVFPSNIPRGGHLSEEHRRKMSESHIGKKLGHPSPLKNRKRPEEVGRKVSAALKGRVFPERRGVKNPKNSQALKGKKKSPGVGAKISASKKGNNGLKGKPSPHKGKKRPDISAKLLGRKRPDIAIALTGRVQSEEHRRNNSESKKSYYSQVRLLRNEIISQGKECSWRQALAIFRSGKK